MIVIVCLDRENGMLFHNRRQSRDREVKERLQQICKGKKVWMNHYSSRLYGEMDSVDTAVSDSFMSEAGNGDFCFVESDILKPFEENIEAVIAFRWDKKYPADFYMDLELSDWEKIGTQEFPGYSHETITEEIYMRGDEGYV